MPVSPAFAALKDAYDLRYRGTSAAAFTQADGTVLGLGLPALDAALAGGFPKGAISTLEGAPSSGRTALAARALAVTTAGGGAAGLIDWNGDPNGAPYAAAMAAAGVDLERLLIVRVGAPLDVVRAADILLRSKAFGTIVLPAVPASRSVSAATWTRLASLAHHAGAVLLVVGADASNELRYFASLRVECTIERARWSGPAPGLFRELAGYDVCARVCKHKRAVPTGTARVGVGLFERRAPLDPALATYEIAPIAAAPRTLARGR